MEFLNAFWVGGVICALAQILMEKTKMLPGRIMVLLVCIGAVISALGWYESFAEYAGAGATVPLMGYGNLLMTGVKEALEKFISEITSDVRDLFICGEHIDVDLYPAEIQESRRRIFEYINLLPENMQEHYTNMMESYFDSCNE